MIGLLHRLLHRPVEAPRQRWQRQGEFLFRDLEAADLVEDERRRRVPRWLDRAEYEHEGGYRIPNFRGLW
jgi:hypothetical protein